MPGFYMECHTGLKLVKREEYSLLQILNLSLPNCFKSSFVNNTQNSKPFWRLSFGRGSVVCPPSSAERLRDIQHSMSMVLDTRVHIWFIMTVYYKNATCIITKCDSCFITKCSRSLLQNVSGFLLQNVTVLLENVTVITNCENFITKCNSYHKMWYLLQIATVQIHQAPWIKGKYTKVNVR